MFPARIGSVLLYVRMQILHNYLSKRQVSASKRQVSAELDDLVNITICPRSPTLVEPLCHVQTYWPTREEKVYEIALDAGHRTGISFFHVRPPFHLRARRLTWLPDSRPKYSKSEQKSEQICSRYDNGNERLSRE